MEWKIIWAEMIMVKAKIYYTSHHAYLPLRIYIAVCTCYHHCMGNASVTYFVFKVIIYLKTIRWKFDFISSIITIFSSSGIDEYCMAIMLFSQPDRITEHL